MRTITRYILTELIFWFFVWLVVLTVVLVVLGLLTEAIRMNLGLMPTLRLVPYILPTSLSFSVPGTILFTCCQVYGRMSAENEVVAAKALGISPLVLLAPAFAFALVLSMVGVWLNDLAFTWGHAGVQRVVLHSVEEIAYNMLRSQKAYSNQRFSIIVKEVRGRILIRPIMNFQSGGDAPMWTVTAATAELQSNLERNTLLLIMDDCEIDVAGARSVLPGRTVQEISLAGSNTTGGQRYMPPDRTSGGQSYSRRRGEPWPSLACRSERRRLHTELARPHRLPGPPASTHSVSCSRRPSRSDKAIGSIGYRLLPVLHYGLISRARCACVCRQPDRSLSGCAPQEAVSLAQRFQRPHEHRPDRRDDAANQADDQGHGEPRRDNVAADQ
jgi:hypothetical protein